jgi:hypothetical protein
MVRLIPKDISFFAMFSEICNNLISGARVLVALFDNYHAIVRRLPKLKESSTSAMN